MNLKSKTIYSPLLATILLGILVGWSDAAVIINITESQTSSNVLIAGSGTINLSELTPLLKNRITSGRNINPSVASLSIGSGFLDSYSGISGPSNFGIGSNKSFLGTASDFLSIRGAQGEIAVPTNYISGVELNSNGVINTASFNSLGLTIGTYVWTWGTGTPNADSITINIIPEPSSAVLIGLAGLGLLVCRRTRRHPSPIA